MKYIKTFENNNDPHYGDYVVINSKDIDPEIAKDRSGRIYIITSDMIQNKNDNIYNISYLDMKNYSIYVYRSEIIFYSKNLSEVEEFFNLKYDTNKFNL